MEEAPLLTVTADTEKRAGGDAEGSPWSEVRKQLYLAGPLVAGYLLVNTVQMVSLMFAGHLGELELAGVSVATSFASVTGLSVLAGMATGLDTLCGQAFGAGRHRLLGVHKQRAMLVLTLLSVPVAGVWACAGEILAWCGQDPEIAAAAGSYTRWLIPALLVYAPLQCHVRFLQAQKLVLPVMLSSGAAALGHPAVCWLLVRRLGLGSRGVALANAVSYLGNLSLMALYPSCRTTWTGFSGEAFRGIPGLLKLAVPSAAMICMEWWSFELLVLLAGLLPNTKLETAVLSNCTRVSNELGAGRPRAAGLATRVVMFLAFSVCVSEGLAMVLVRNILGYAYSNDDEVAKYTARLMPALAVCILFDGLQNVLSGVVRGCGRQKLGAVINLVAYYAAGIPAAFLFAFVCRLGGMGLWFGLLCELVVQMLLLLPISACANWNGEVSIYKFQIQSNWFSCSQLVLRLISWVSKH
ncbi:hypothetical protein PAHAL_1G132800 [Panicum hallii]|uniref:Protein DETOXIFICATION n=1 Tax=Panicum hallii TaxID=206008 RepID=A0A2T8KV75_9POAL|nr:hypothetical protein PAHAL_1G132800 [Panicum hallii]PVH66042.1 hypothetical protein PAHAL_1G132800 [Panicum hallii]